MGLADFFKKPESLLAIDIGATSVKLLQLEEANEKPHISAATLSELAENPFSNNVLAKPERVAERIGELVETLGLTTKRVAVALPAPSVFTKRITLPRVEMAQLHETVQMEAANFIPHNIDAVSLDFHVLRRVEKNQLEILVVAVKNEILDSYTDCLAMSGLEAAVVDVDFFALQNAFEAQYPELIAKTVALINVGARYSSVAVCRNGLCLFTGDIAVGGKVLSDALTDGLGIAYNEAEKIKKNASAGKVDDRAAELLDKNVEYTAGEFNRQLSFFWNASGADEGIDVIILAGGGGQLKGLCDELSERTGIECRQFETFRSVEFGEEVDKVALGAQSMFFPVALGLGLRRLSDKIYPEDL